MQWSKSKTYIITALLITNLILLFSIYSDKQSKIDIFSEKNLKNLEQLLKNKNIKSEVKLNTNTKKASAIEIKYANLKDEKLKNVYQKYKNSIKLIDDLYIEVQFQNKLKFNDIDEFVNFSKNFIKECFGEENYKIKYAVKKEEEMVISYEEWYDSMFVEQGYLNFRYNLNNSVNLSIFKIKDIKKLGKEFDIISNAQAVAKLIPQIEKDEIIKDVQLGYYIKKEPNREDDDKMARLVKLIPFWRIRLKNDNYIYTEAIKN